MYEVLATVTPSAPRRLFGVTVLMALGGIVIYVALTKPPAAFGWQLFLLGFGGIAIWGADRVRQATRFSIELTEEGLRDTSGRVLARIEDIARVERGIFAMKPSSGFMLCLNKRNSRAWAPGLWWRIGRRVGVGGVTPPSQGKNMAEMVTALLAQRGVDD